VWYLVDMFDEVVETGYGGKLDFSEDRFFQRFRERLIYPSCRTFLSYHYFLEVEYFTFQGLPIRHI